MSVGMLYINGQEAEATFGILVTSFAGDLSTPARTINLLNIPSLAGAIDPGLTPNESVRVLTVNFLVHAASKSVLYASLDAIKDACGNGLVELQTPYSTTRALYGVLQTCEAAAQTPTLLNGWVSGTMTFLCATPYWFDIAPTTVAFTTATAIPLGTAPSFGRDQFSAIITITGAATTPTLTYKDYAGVTVGTMVFSYSPLAGDSIVIDCGRHLVTRLVSGVSSNALSYLAAGYTFPALSPDDASFAASLWPTLTVSSGTGSVVYYRAFR
jgi:hypothetical protein